jgi:uncharacterized membrane protein
VTLPLRRPGRGTTAQLRAATAPVALGITTALVLLSAAWKSACLDASQNYRRTCYSDVLELWTSRGLRDAVFPYVQGRLVDGAPVDTFEYPVLTGVFVWASSLLADGRASFLVVSTVLLLPFALLTTWHLHRLAGRRALLWVASPSLVLYALHNWDLLPVAAATAALWSWARGRHVAAAVLLAVGACLKVYPGLFVLPLVVDRFVRGDVAGALRVLSAAGLTVVAVNLPFVVAGREGWAATYAFQSARAADSSSNSLWYWVLPQVTTERLNVLVPSLLAVALVVAVADGVRRSRAAEDFPLVQVCGAVLVAFLLLNKVHSPQYTLWLLPFFALLRVHWRWWAAFTVADALVYVGVFRWFHALVAGTDPSLPAAVLETGVWAKCLLLLVLFPVLLRAPTAVRQPTQRPEVNVSTSSAMTGADSAR